MTIIIIVQYANTRPKALVSGGFPDDEEFGQVIPCFQWFSTFLFATLRRIRDTSKKIYNQKYREHAKATRSKAWSLLCKGFHANLISVPDIEKCYNVIKLNSD